HRGRAPPDRSSSTGGVGNRALRVCRERRGAVEGNLRPPLPGGGWSVTFTYSYTTTDVETVVRRFTADLVMIAQSSGALTESSAREYAHDVEELAKAGYLKAVDLTLFSGATEVRATTYLVDTDARSLTMNRPGGVLWPRVVGPRFRIVLTYTPD